MTRKNRLSSIFEDFANRSGLPYKFDENFQKVDLEIPISNEKSITASYRFDTSQDRYEFGAPIGIVDSHNKRESSSKILKSDSLGGITERIVDKKLIVFGSRSGLLDFSDVDLKRFFLEDVNRIAEACQKKLAGDTTTDAPPPDVSKKKKKRKGK